MSCSGATSNLIWSANWSLTGEDCHCGFAPIAMGLTTPLGV
jgi:hypothetical protein